MRRACIPALFLVALSACAGQPAPEGATPCGEPRPQICTMEYNPTCAILESGERKEFASPCSACADAAVTATLNGPCEQ